MRWPTGYGLIGTVATCQIACIALFDSLATGFWSVATSCIIRSRPSIMTLSAISRQQLSLQRAFAAGSTVGGHCWLARSSAETRS
jgi:hypothetical protein